MQFHPEFDKNIMNLYIKEVSNHQDLETEELIVLSEETIVSTKIIKEFERLFL